MAKGRARLDLDHLTDRLLASRSKPKRQYLIEQIRLIWSSGPKSCIRSPEAEHRHRHPPTEASVSAVASFADDPLVTVRTAVCGALGANADAARMALPILRQLLADSAAVVRIAAARAILLTRLASDIDPVMIRQLLADKVWTVRWEIAAALAGGPFHAEAWRVLANSIPRTPEMLEFWAYSATRFSDDLMRDPVTRAALKEKLEASTDPPEMLDMARWLLANSGRQVPETDG
jgi:hypothetical protein